MYPAGTRRLLHKGGKLISASGVALRPELVHAVAEATRDLPEGYRAEIFSAADARTTGTKNHPNGIAIDLRIIDPNNEELPAAGFDASLKIYERLFQSVRIRAQHLFPGRNLTWIWGGAWISQAAGYGDRMHYQIHDPARPVIGASTNSGAYNPQTGIARSNKHASAFMSPAELSDYQARIEAKARADYAAGIPAVPRTAAEAIANSSSGTIEGEPMSWTFEETKGGYSYLWASAALKGGADAINADSFSARIIAAESRYRAAQAATGVPWFFIGALHMRESSCDFSGVLHNGERIIGTGRLTTLVPDGRGPFSTWEESAIDALKLKNLHRVQDWSVARMLYSAEVYNGLGYVSRGINSPYVWAGTSHEQPGKFVADHVFDPNADDKQLGVAAALIRLSQLRPDIKAALAPQQEPSVSEPAQPNNQTIDIDVLAQKIAVVIAPVLANALADALRNLTKPGQPQLPPPVEPKPEPPPVQPPSGQADLLAKILGFLGLAGAFLGQATGTMPVTEPTGLTVAGTSVFSILGGILNIVSPTLGGILRAARGAMQGMNNTK